MTLQGGSRSEESDNCIKSSGSESDTASSLARRPQPGVFQAGTWQ